MLYLELMRCCVKRLNADSDGVCSCACLACAVWQSKVCCTEWWLHIQEGLRVSNTSQRIMGNANSHQATSSPSPQQERRKRLAEEMIGEHEVEDVTPRKKRIQTTSDYIYETLFNRGADSDITICALGGCGHLMSRYPRSCT